MQLNSYLTFNGQCEAAFKFYEQCLGGTIGTMLTHGNSPVAKEVPSEWHNKILHASLTVGDHVLMGADAPPDRYEKPQGFSVMLELKDATEADRVFQAFTEKGTVQMQLQETFWALRFGMLIDRFGIPWMINCGPGNGEKQSPE